MKNDTEPTAKEKTIYWLKCLIELIEADQVRADEIEDMTPEQVIAMAEAAAERAVQESGKLARGE